MADLLPILVMAVVQGVAEFLPISSSGHLMITAGLFEAAGHPLPDVLGVTIMLHAGTLLSIFVFYWHRIWRLLGADRRVIGLLIVGSIPAAIVGFGLKKVFAAELESPLLAGCCLPLTALWLWFGAKRPAGETDYTEMGYGQALVIGLCQAVAILPGISRSGSTIVAGLWMGLRRDAAASFSFLLALPVTAGACLLEAKDLLESGVAANQWSAMALGATVSFFVGLGALAWLLNWLQRGRLHHFAWWCLGMGVAVIAWQLTAMR